MDAPRHLDLNRDGIINAADLSLSLSGNYDSATIAGILGAWGRRTRMAPDELPLPIVYIGTGFSDGLGWRDGYKTEWQTDPGPWLISRIEQYHALGVRSFMIDCPAGYHSGHKVSGYQYSLMTPSQHDAIAAAAVWLESQSPGNWRLGPYMGVWFDKHRVSLRTHPADPTLDPQSSEWAVTILGEIDGFAGIGCNMVGLDNASSIRVIVPVLQMLEQIEAMGVFPIGEAIPIGNPVALETMHWFATRGLLDKTYMDPERSWSFRVADRVLVGLHGWEDITGEDREAWKRRGYKGFVIYDHGRGDDPLSAEHLGVG